MLLQIFLDDYPQSAASGGKTVPRANIADFRAGWLRADGLAKDFFDCALTDRSYNK